MDSLPHMLRLLDDDEPSTQSALKSAFSDTSGDLSDELAALGVDLSSKDQNTLSSYLEPARRKKLIEDWRTPATGISGLDEDWEEFEHLLRLLSDFLHNGINLRPSLSDSLDIWANEFLSSHNAPTADKLRLWLFEQGRLTGNKEDYYSPLNSDLAHSLNEGTGNPIGLAVIYQLIGQRCGLEISTSNYPGHFLARISINSSPNLVDCFNRGLLIPIDKLIQENKEISREAKFAVLTDCPLGVSLLRIVRNLELSFNKLKRTEDAKVLNAIAESLTP